MLGTLLTSLFGGRRARITTLGGLAEFMAARTAFVSQKVTLDYCRARAALHWQKLLGEEPFLRALEYCRWEAYAAVLGDVAEVVQIYLRRAGAPEPPLPEVVGDLARAALLRHPVPSHRESWDEVVDAIRARLQRANLAAPRPVHLVGTVSAPRVFEVLPIHGSVRRHDREVVTNSLRFLLVRVYGDLEQQVDGSAVVAAIAEGAEATETGSAARPIAGP